MRMIRRRGRRGGGGGVGAARGQAVVAMRARSEVVRPDQPRARLYTLGLASESRGY